jgi:hypothetical protein
MGTTLHEGGLPPPGTDLAAAIAPKRPPGAHTWPSASDQD